MTAAAHRSNLSMLMLSFLLITSWAGCSGNTEKSTGDNTGAIAYRLLWNTEPVRESNHFKAQSVTGDICEDYHIEWIHALLLDQDGEPLTSEKWPCNQHKGELAGIPAGTYNFRIEGEVASGITWRGEATDVQVSGNTPTDAGVITMSHLKDHDPPAVIQAEPEEGTTGVPVDSAVSVTFDNAVVAKSIDAENFTLTYTDPMGEIQQVEGEMRYVNERYTAVITPTAALLTDTTYTATLSVDEGKEVQDLAGNPMQETFQWSFTTVNSNGEGPPQVISRAPRKDTMDVVTTAIVQVQFSEPVDPQTISMESVRLEHHGAPIQCDIQYDDELSMVTLRPVDGLPLGTTVTVAVTTDILDAEGNPMTEDDSWAFVTQFPPWHTEYLGADHADLATRIALETNDTVHIELRREMGGRSMSCERISANNWNISAPSISEEIGKYFDKAFDAQDTRFDVRVLTVTNLFEVLIAFSNGGGMGRFPIELHDPMTNLKGISIATNDGQGDLKFSICFYDAHDAQLKYYGGYFNENIESSNETVDISSGEHCDIAMSLNDVPHLSYHDPANRHLRYATRSPDGVWSKEAIDEDTATGPHTAIAVDLAGRPHICYRDESNASLKYAYQLPSGDWLVETVDSSVSIGDTLDIALDSFDQAHISYRDSDNRALKYAVKTGTGLWYTQLVDTEDSNGFGSAIAVDSQDYVHISYCHQIPVHIGNNVRYATNRPQN